MTISDDIWIAIVASVPPTLTALLAFRSVQKAVKETHMAVNSRMDELLRITRESSKAEGIKEEKDRSGI